MRTPGRRALVGALGMGTVAAAALFAGCPAAKLALAVELQTDFVPGVEFTAVRTEAFRDEPTPGAQPAASDDRSALRGDDYLSARRVASLHLESGSFFVRVRLLTAAGSVVGEAVSAT